MITQTSWSRLREIVKCRDSEICQYCGNHAPGGAVDHVLPLAQGGMDGIDNLVWACVAYNQEKGSKTLREWITTLGDRKAEQQNEGALWIEETSLSDRIDWTAAGWSCDCGGYCRVMENKVVISDSYHKADCPISRLQITGLHYSPRHSRIVGGRALLYSVILYLEDDSEEKYLLSKDRLDAFGIAMAELDWEPEKIRWLDDSGEVEL